MDGATGASAASPLNNEGGVTLDLNNLLAYVPRISSDNGLRVAKFTIDQPPPAPIVIGKSVCIPPIDLVLSTLTGGFDMDAVKCKI